MYSEFDIVSIKTILSLLIFLGIMIFLLFVLKRFRPGSIYNSRFPVMRTVGTLNLAPKRAIALVEICEQYFVIGIGAESVSLISRMDIPPDNNLSNNSDRKGDGKFQGLLERAGLSRKKQETEEPDNI